MFKEYFKAGLGMTVGICAAGYIIGLVDQLAKVIVKSKTEE